MTLLEIKIRLRTLSLKLATMMGRGGKWGSNRFHNKKEVDPNQKKITHFFRKAGDDAGSIPSSPSRSTLFRAPLRQSRVLLYSRAPNTGSTSSTAETGYSDDEGEVEILTPPTPQPKELIVLSSSSDSELEGEAEAQLDKVKVSPSQTNHNQVEGEAFCANNNVTEAPPSHTNGSVEENGCGMSSDSSGDEILSQIDVEEVIRLSQSSVEGSPARTLLQEDANRNDLISPGPRLNMEKEDVAETSCLELPSTSTAITANYMRPPRISPKSQLNKFSPIKHLRKKRSSSEASLDGSTPPTVTKSGLSPGGRSPKKKLNFDNKSSSSTSGGVGVGVGGGRYYLRNFMSILVEVISDPFHGYLLNDEDHKTVQSFTSLSMEAQSLYVRLFQRKWGWKPIQKLNNNYKELPDDLTDLCEELTKLHFFEKISASNSNLEEVLETLDLVKMGNLAKRMMISTVKKTKEAFKKALLTKVKSQKTLSGSCGSVAILKSALTELGPAFRVSSQSKLLFSRLFILHSPPNYWEVEQDQASNQLLVILLNNMGQMEYPSYRIQKTVKIYRGREDLLQFHAAFIMHSNLVAYSESKDYAAVVELATRALCMFMELLQKEEALNHDSGLPRYLRIYTAGSALCHTCWMGVDGFQKLKRFSEANELINRLLNQSTYLPNYRGRLWERLAINSGHLREGKEAIHALLEKALKDPFLQDNHKLILSQRLEKVRQSIEVAASKVKKAPKKRLPKRKGARQNKNYIDEESGEEENIEEVCPTSTNDAETQLLLNALPEENSEPPVDILRLRNEIPTRTIIGEKMDRGPGSMGKSVFISRQDSSGSNRMSSVEQHAIQYYMEHEDYTGGIHGEGSTVVTLYGLLFWDVLFDDNIPDVFRNQYQAFPLDLQFDDFYQRRKDKIEEKLELIRDILSVDDLFGIVEEVWTKNEKTLSIVSWSLWENNLEGLRSLMNAMGTEMIAKICGRLARNYRYYSSGFPDVVVWNEGDRRGGRKVLFAEVKGPGDSLSAKQQLWLDFLVGNGIPAEVCHVKAVSNKRIRLDR